MQSRRRWARQLLVEATRAVQLETGTQDESPRKEELELLRESCDLRLDGTLVRQAFKAGKAIDWSELVKSNRLNAWTSAKLQECCSEVKPGRRRGPVFRRRVRAGVS